MENTEKLIRAVKPHAVLYDMCDIGYRSKNSKDKIWNEIGESLDMSGETAKKKWKGLKDCYQKYLRSMRTNPEITPKILLSYRSYRWAKEMSFLKPYLEREQIDSNLSSVEINNDEVQFSKPIADSSIAEHNSNDSSTYDNQQEFHSPYSSAYEHQMFLKPEDLVSNLESDHSKVITDDDDDDDDVDLMFKSFAKTVKRFSSQRQAIVKAKLVKLITDEELDHLREILS